MAGFCPDEWHQTTEDDLHHKSLGGNDYEYEVWQTLLALPQRSPWPLLRKQREQKIVTDQAHALAVERGLIPYTEATFLSLMEEVEGRAAEAKATPDG